MIINNKKYFIIAVPKGKLFNNTAQLLHRLGYISEVNEDSRTLMFPHHRKKVAVVVAKPIDIPAYVEAGTVDVGIVGNDTILEENKKVIELLDLKYGACRVVLAAPQKVAQTRIKSYAGMRVATKYPNIAKRYLCNYHVTMNIVKLNGLIELAPIIGHSEIILDLVETGRTLKENGLVEIAHVLNSSARLITSKYALSNKQSHISKLMDGLTVLLQHDCNHRL